MTKTVTPKSTAAKSRKTAKPPKPEFNIKDQFVSTSLSMTWQLAIVVLVPIIGGYELDKHLNTLPFGTIFGLLIATAGTILIVQKTLREFNDKIDRTNKS